MAAWFFAIMLAGSMPALAQTDVNVPTVSELYGQRLQCSSGASQDHAVAVEPWLIERVETVRGPGALLYGSGAVGGVVNVTTSRILDKVPERVNGKAAARFGTNDSARGGAALLNAPVGSKFAVHGDGALKASDNYRIRNDEQVPNSFKRTGSEAIGASYVGARGYLGSSFSVHESIYGTVAEEFVHIKMRQQRADLEGEARDWAGMKYVRGRFSSTNYKHDEIEDGSVATTFKNDGQEGRLEFRHPAVLGMKGLFGLQMTAFDFSAKGDERFLPSTHNENQAVFLFEEKEQGSFRPSFGLRLEQAEVKSKDDALLGEGTTRSFANTDSALGFIQNLSEHYSVALNGSLTERSPNYQELFANGDHVAAGIHELGDKNLKREKSRALELSLRHKGPLGQGFVGAFLQDYDDYIALMPTGVAGPPPEYVYVNTDARFYGAELEYRHNISHLIQSGTSEFEMKFDWRRGKSRSTGDNLPRVTPMRETLGLVYRTAEYQTDIELQRSERQRDLAPHETGTGDYTLVNLGFEQPVQIAGEDVSLFGRLNNVFDVEARNHISLLKDRAPLPGRNFLAGVQATF